MITAGGSWHNALEKGIRCERALLMTLAELYAHRVIHAQSSCHHSATLDEELEAWRNRPLRKIVSAVLMGFGEDWECGRVYLIMRKTYGNIDREATLQYFIRFDT